MFLHLYIMTLYSMCVQLTSAIKSKVATISMETNRGEKRFCFFSIIFHTDHNKTGAIQVLRNADGGGGV